MESRIARRTLHLAALAALLPHPHGLAAAPAPLRLRFDASQGFILIPGRVDGLPGVFMLDTGTPFDFFLNRALVPLVPGAQVAAGNASSGQSITVQRHPGEHRLRLAGAPAISIRDVRSGDLAFVANALHMPLLGFIGFEFLNNFEFTLDYRRQIVTLVPLGSAFALSRPPPRVLHVHVRGNLPAMTLNLDGIDIPAELDTGAAGSIQLSAQTRAVLERTGRLSRRASPEGPVVVLRGVHEEGRPITLAELDEQVGDADTDIITLGFRFLSQYRSVWNYQAMTIGLYPR